MPKGKGKGKGAQRARAEGSSDDDSVYDNASVISYTSDSKSVLDDGKHYTDEALPGDEVDEQSQEDVFEEKLRDAIDGLSQKSAQGRTLCLEGISKALIKRYIPDFVADRRVTLCDCVERCLRRGRGAEQAAAAQLATILSIQLGCTEEVEQLCADLMSPLSFVARDDSVPPTARAKCCWAMAVITFLSGCELNEVIELMRTLESIFGGSYAKGDGSMPTVTPEMAALHTATLSAWSLLLTLLSPGDVFMFTSSKDCTYLPDLNKLIQLLDSAHLELRMTAGEVLALIYELGRAHNEDFCDDLTDDLVDRLRSLATDSHKYRAKKDRKQQRSSFRDILQYVEDGIPPEIQVKFAQEVLVLDTWCRKKLYDAFCQVLGSGMNCHLGDNDMLRDMFDLGDKPTPLNPTDRKLNKNRRNLANSAATKARNISRNRNRDKRSTVMLC